MTRLEHVIYCHLYLTVTSCSLGKEMQRICMLCNFAVSLRNPILNSRGRKLSSLGYDSQVQEMTPVSRLMNAYDLPEFFSRKCLICMVQATHGDELRGLAVTNLYIGGSSQNRDTYSIFLILPTSSFLPFLMELSNIKTGYKRPS
jgi:hypothetical protein